MIETHPNPPEALSDGPQSLYFDAFADLMEGARRVAGAVGRGFPAALEAEPA